MGREVIECCLDLDLLVVVSSWLLWMGIHDVESRELRCSRTKELRLVFSIGIIIIINIIIIKSN